MTSPDGITLISMTKFYKAYDLFCEALGISPQYEASATLFTLYHGSEYLTLADKSSKLGLITTSYFRISEHAVERLEQLSGPHARTLIKAWKAQQDK